MTWTEFPEEVRQAAREGARFAWAKWKTVPLDDLIQDVEIYIATHADTVQTYMDDPEKGLKYVRMYAHWHAFSISEREAKHQDKHIPLDKFLDPWEDD